MQWDRFRYAWPFVFLLAASGCASTRPTPVTDTESLWGRYDKAVQAAKIPQPAHISKQLVPIATFTPGLTWDQSGQKVLMATWTKAQYYTDKTLNDETTIPAVVWLTATPFLQRFCRQTGLQGDALRLRLAQRLGMPPDAANDSFVQMWVDPHLFFRPCPDPEINDQECQVNLTAGTADSSGACPWSAALQDQLSGAFVTVAQGHLDWMCSNWTSSYPPGEPRKSYPWTALGYTYDWGSKNVHGESEFVLPANKPVVIESVTPMDVYCAPD